MVCPCGSLQPFDACCGPLLRGERKARTPLELMKSRYSAYAMGDGDYLVRTTSKANRVEEDAVFIKEFARTTQWLKLEVLDEEDKGEAAYIEFKAYSRQNGVISQHHEKSRFVFEEGEWFYDEGQLFEGKIGRNEPCPCGSGKKYKRCCAKA